MLSATVIILRNMYKSPYHGTLNRHNQKNMTYALTRISVIKEFFQLFFKPCSLYTAHTSRLMTMNTVLCGSLPVYFAGFWMLWMLLIIFCCFCVFRHRRIKLRTQQEQRQREINLIAYNEACTYPSSMLDLSMSVQTHCCQCLKLFDAMGAGSLLKRGPGRVLWHL